MVPHLISTLRYVAITLFLFYAAIPMCIYLFPVIHRHFLFMNHIKWPYTNYTNPKKLGVENSCRNFRVETEPEIKLGVWHILPNSLNYFPTDSDQYETLLSESDKPIILYLHGNAWTRSASHRIKLYNVLASAEYHVIAIDYRGYGDSTGSPSEEGVIHDAVFMYKWIKERAGKNPVFVWSHSLGTAIGTAAVKRLCNQDLCPTGFVLEAPFNNLPDIVRHHVITKPFRWLPYFDKIMVEPFERIGLYFTTDERIKHVACPMLILHARDDRVVPFRLGEKLKEVALEYGRDVTFMDFSVDLNYGHKYICNSPELVHIFKKFVSKCQSIF